MTSSSNISSNSGRIEPSNIVRPKPLAQPTMKMGTIGGHTRAEVMNAPVQEKVNQAMLKDSPTKYPKTVTKQYRKTVYDALALFESLSTAQQKNTPQTIRQRPLSVRMSDSISKFETPKPKPPLKPEKVTKGEVKKAQAEVKNIFKETIPIIKEESLLPSKKESFKSTPESEHKPRENLVEESRDSSSEEQSSNTLRTSFSSINSENQSVESTPKSSRSNQELPISSLSSSRTDSQTSITAKDQPSRRGSITDITDDVTLTENIIKTKSISVANFLKKGLENLKLKLESKESKSLREIEQAMPEAFKMEENREVLIKDIMKVATIASKKLKKGYSMEIQVPSLKNHTIVIMKSAQGNVDVLKKTERRLGEGAFGVAFRAYSFKEKTETVLKIPQQSEISKLENPSPQDLEQLREDKEEYEASLKNEEEITQHLNADGQHHEGVQDVVKISLFKNGTEVEIATKGKIYSKGDFHKPVLRSRLLRQLDISPNEFKLMDDSELTEKIEKKTNALKNFIHEKIKEKNEILARSDLHLKGKKELTTPIDNTITKEINRFVKNLSLVDFMDKKEGEKKPGEKFTQAVSDLQANLLYNPNFKPAEGIEVFCSELNKTILEVAKKGQGVEEVPLKKRMIFGKNLVNGLLYIHSEGVIHGDIKPQNIFVSEQEAVLADFGGAQRREKKYSKVIPHTKDYAAEGPLDAMIYYEKNNQEENKFRAGRSLDIRALGLTLYDMYAGGPLPDVSDKGTYYSDKTYKDMKQNLIDHTIPNDIAKIIAKMCKPQVFDLKYPPKEFPLPVTDAELKKLADLLEKSTKARD